MKIADIDREFLHRKLMKIADIDREFLHIL